MVVNNETVKLCCLACVGVTAYLIVLLIVFAILNQAVGLNEGLSSVFSLLLSIIIFTPVITYGNRKRNEKQTEMSNEIHTFENNVEKSDQSEEQQIQNTVYEKEDWIKILANSDCYRYIEAFAKKYPRCDISSEEFSKLYDIIISEDIDLSKKMLYKIMNDEIENQAYIEFKRKIGSESCSSFQMIIENYLMIFGDNRLEERERLKRLLEEKFGQSPESLEDRIYSIKKSIETDKFKNHLLDPSSIQSRYNISDIDNLDGYAFELLLKKLFEKMGYQVTHTSLSGDQGADLIISKLGEKCVVQAKRYSGNVGNSAIQEVTAAIPFYGGTRGMVVTNSYYTPAAIALAKSNGVDLIDRDTLSSWLENYPINMD